MAKKQTAVVTVSKAWFNTSIRFLLNEGRESRSTGSEHLILAQVDDLSDQHGLWLKNIKTTQLTKDASAKTMKFMIPWAFVLAIGVIEDENPRASLGFIGDTSIDVSDTTGQE